MNSVALPIGLLYTTLLTPIFYIWLVMKGKKYILINFLLASAAFAGVHLMMGVDLTDYAKSYLLLLSAYIFCYAFYVFLSKKQALLTNLFTKVAKVNFLLTLIAIFALSTTYSSYFWTTSAISASLSGLPRLMMFTYEPSYYSTLLIPVTFYFFLLFFFRATLLNFSRLAILIIPLILSFSLGVLGSAGISVVLFFLTNYHKVLTKNRFFKWVVRIFTLVVLLSMLLLLLYPQNPLFLRIQDIMEGADSSAKGRTFEAFELALIIAKLKSLWWGVGLGQVKTVGYETIISYYNYPRELFPTVRIPNAFAETLAVFGVIGAFLRLSTEVFLFFKTNVLNNYYRTLLFFFVFIYQFTGSYLTNIAEYVIWILAFSNAFPEFDKSHLSPLIKLKPRTDTAPL